MKFATMEKVMRGPILLILVSMAALGADAAMEAARNRQDRAMLEKAIHDSVDCVTGVRRKRQDNFIRRFSSRVANGFRNWITGDQVSDSGCGIRVVRRAALREIPVFNGMHRFLPTLLRGQGYTVAETTVNHRERLRGTSKYGVHNRLWRGIRDCFGIRWYLKRAVRSDRLGKSR